MAPAQPPAKPCETFIFVILPIAGDCDTCPIWRKNATQRGRHNSQHHPVVILRILAPRTSHRSRESNDNVMIHFQFLRPAHTMPGGCIHFKHFLQWSLGLVLVSRRLPSSSRAPSSTWRRAAPSALPKDNHVSSKRKPFLRTHLNGSLYERRGPDECSWRIYRGV